MTLKRQTPIVKILTGLQLRLYLHRNRAHKYVREHMTLKPFAYDDNEI